MSYKLRGLLNGRKSFIHAFTFEEKPIVFLDYPFSLNAPMAKKGTYHNIKKVYFFLERRTQSQPCFRKRWKRGGYGNW